jgi:hypothetical protein
MADVAEWIKLKESLVGYLDSDDISPTLAQALRIPSNRHAIYYWLAGNQHHEFRALLQHLLELEISFRQSEELEDDEYDYFGGIYQCAFLLGRCGQPSDTKALWKFNA